MISESSFRVGVCGDGPHFTSHMVHCQQNSWGLCTVTWDFYTGVAGIIILLVSSVTEFVNGGGDRNRTDDLRFCRPRAFALARSHPPRPRTSGGESKKQIRRGFDETMESLERNRFWPVTGLATMPWNMPPD